jgi:hypothetical protein
MEIDLQTILKGINMYKVASSNLAAVGYNATSKVLRVIFNGGSSYLYFGVEPIVWDALCKSQSKGRFLTENVTKRKDKYKYIKI